MNHKTLHACTVSHKQKPKIQEAQNKSDKTTKDGGVEDAP